MSTRTRLDGALDALLSELHEVAAWERETADETRRAAASRERLEFSVRATIALLPPPERTPYLARLRRALGEPEPRPIPCNSQRVRDTLDWLALREPPEFAVAELAAHLRAKGHAISRGYIPALLARWEKLGAVERLGGGRWRMVLPQVGHGRW